MTYHTDFVPSVCSTSTSSSPVFGAALIASAEVVRARFRFRLRFYVDLCFNDRSTRGTSCQAQRDPVRMLVYIVRPSLRMNSMQFSVHEVDYGSLERFYKRTTKRGVSNLYFPSKGSVRRLRKSAVNTGGEE